MFVTIFLVGLGGAIGSISRFLVTEFFLKLTKNYPFFINKFANKFIGKFPIATFTVNVLGSMLAGVAYYFIIKNLNATSNHIKNFILIGFLGGFTTFSAFSLDFFRLYNSGNLLMAVNYVFLSILFSFCALFLSFYLCKTIFS